MKRIVQAARIRSAFARPRGAGGAVNPWNALLVSRTGLSWNHLWLADGTPSIGEEVLVAESGATGGHTPTGYFPSILDQGLMRFGNIGSAWASASTSFANIVQPVIFAVMFRVRTLITSGIFSIFGKRISIGRGFELGINIDGCLVFNIKGDSTATVEAGRDHQAAQHPQIVVIRVVPGGNFEMITLLNDMPIAVPVPLGVITNAVPFSIGNNRLLAPDIEVGFMGISYDPGVVSANLNEVMWGIAKEMVMARCIDNDARTAIDDDSRLVYAWK